MKKLNLSHFESKPEVRSEGDVSYLVGLACPYNAWSKPLFGFMRERFLPTAFDNCLKENPEVICVVDHNKHEMLSRTGARSLMLDNRSDGLYIKSHIPNTTYALNCVENVRNKNIPGMSFVFDTVQDEWGHDGEFETRTVKEAWLKEVCFTVAPAYSDTFASLRSDVWNEAELRVLAATRIPKAPTVGLHIPLAKLRLMEGK